MSRSDVPDTAAGQPSEDVAAEIAAAGSSGWIRVDNRYPAGELGVFDLGNRHYVAPHGDAGYRWWHDCPAVEHVSWGWFGQVSSDQVSGHRIVHHVPSLTVEGSLLCTDCGDHGFIRDTKWVPA